MIDCCDSEGRNKESDAYHVADVVVVEAIGVEVELGPVCDVPVVGLVRHESTLALPSD